jgi:subtilisin family serine protease
LSKEIKKNGNVEYFRIISAQPIKPPYDIKPATQNFISKQGYLDKNPGLNVKYAWEQGANGKNIKISVVEFGVNIKHEEFNEKNITISKGMTISPKASEAFTEHGTATAGVIYSDFGNYGINGMAYNATSYELFPEWTVENDYDRIRAVSNVVNKAKKGDLIIYEMQAEGKDKKYVPAEYEKLIWDLTKKATDKGVIIVAAAGNGAQDLDNDFYSDYINRGDSGAIIVSAGTSDLNHNPMYYTSYGTRIDVQAWGENVYTTGKLQHSYKLIGNDFNQSYSTYAGTSSATSLIGGVVALLQSYYYELTGNYLTSIEMRNLLKETGIKSKQESKNIGVFPDLKAAIEKINKTLSVDKQLNLKVVVYPTLTDNFININFINNDSQKLIELYSITGKLVHKKSTNSLKNKLDLSSFKRGIYLLKIKDRKSIIFKKILKN